MIMNQRNNDFDCDSFFNFGKEAFNPSLNTQSIPLLQSPIPTKLDLQGLTFPPIHNGHEHIHKVNSTPILPSNHHIFKQIQSSSRCLSLPSDNNSSISTWNPSEAKNFLSGLNQPIFKFDSNLLFHFYKLNFNKDPSTFGDNDLSQSPLSNSPKASDNNNNNHNDSIPKKTKLKTRRKAWKPQEDELLLHLIKEYGTKWSRIALVMKGRSGKQIRDRYLNYLSPDITEKEWTKEEDDLIIFLYSQWGKKWSKIAGVLRGRSEGQVKNRFHWSLKKNIDSKICPNNSSSMEILSEKEYSSPSESDKNTNFIEDPLRFDPNFGQFELEQGLEFDSGKNLINDFHENGYDFIGGFYQIKAPSPDDFISYNNHLDQGSNPMMGLFEDQPSAIPK